MEVPWNIQEDRYVRMYDVVCASPFVRGIKEWNTGDMVRYYIDYGVYTKYPENQYLAKMWFNEHKDELRIVAGSIEVVTNCNRLKIPISCYELCQQYIYNCIQYLFMPNEIPRIDPPQGERGTPLVIMEYQVRDAIRYWESRGVLGAKTSQLALC